MRASKRSRSMRRSRLDPAEHGDLADVVARATYVGSSEHKTYPSFAGPPRPRADASKCDPSLTDAEVITTVLREAMSAGRIGAPLEGDFPRYVWGRWAGAAYEARLVNREQGQYKGYPVTEQEYVTATSSLPTESAADG